MVIDRVKPLIRVLKAVSRGGVSTSKSGAWSGGGKVYG